MSKSTKVYRVAGDGVYNKVSKTFVPSDSDNVHYQKYLEWVSAGNVPDPEFTQDEIDAAVIRDEVHQLKAELGKSLVWQFRMLVEMWQVLKLKCGATNDDIDVEVLTKASEWVTKLNRLKVIDE